MFEELWKFITKRCEEKNFPLVQNKAELEHVFGLMKDCNSYLEVGTAEGNSMYVLAHAMSRGAHITYIDKDEERIRPKREEIISLLKHEGYLVNGIHNDSHSMDAIDRATARHYDCVLIDAGHSYMDALMDARNYGPLADKYIIFHDVQLPAVMEAFKVWQLESNKRGYTIINSEKFGFGVIRL